MAPLSKLERGLDDGLVSNPGIETPLALLGRLRLGREEYCQRLLTMLILDGPYPRWNTTSALAPGGVSFFSALDSACFGDPFWPADPVFIDEFDLPARHEDEAGGAPDYALLWPDRVWMIELKTERSSHRPGQLQGYLDLAAHHYPRHRLDLTYLTPPMPTDTPRLGPTMRFAQLTWADARGFIERTWGYGSDIQRLVAEGLGLALDSIGQSWPDWRTTRLGAEAPLQDHSAELATSVAPEASLDRAVEQATLTARDGRQRALDVDMGSLQELKDLRLKVANTIEASTESDPIRTVRPWLWQKDRSGGRALTGHGDQLGYELRVSRYK